MPTTSSSRHSRAFSPPLSTAGSSQAYTIGQQQKINIVTRLSIEGKAKHNEHGAAVRMYLKISLPQDSVTPGSTIALFPEENIKIVNSQVHPIDINSVPYNFSSATCPLLHNAARALSLPPRSSQSYLTLFGLSNQSTPTLGSSRKSSHNANIPPLDERYTGQILVSGYHVSYVLPKEFPPKPYLNGTGGHDGDVKGSTSSSRSRRASISERNIVQFMAAIDMWVPLLTRPPKAPFLLSIPTPRCLSNNIKVRIFPPNAGTSASLHSLSSAEEDPGSWDLTSDPHVTRSASSRPSRTNAYTHFADDESSDSSTTGFSDGCGIQGTFPSAERIRVRWATPMKPTEGDGRRRVGVKEVKGDMSAVLLGKGRDSTGEGVVMKIEYTGSCNGVWFPGVATLLGMDVSLDPQGSQITWLPGSEPGWSVHGGTGFTGFDVGSPPTALLGPSSVGQPEVHLTAATPERRAEPSSIPSYSRRSSSSASLLRAPLPVQNVADYSFESTPSSATSDMLTSGDLLVGGKSTVSSVNGFSDAAPDVRPPLAPITLHINMNDLLPPSKKTFTFTISGLILVKSRASPWDDGSPSSSPAHSGLEVEPSPVALPRFRVLAADSETVSTVVRNEVEGSTVAVYNSTGDIQDAQTRRTVLQRGASTRCGPEGGRVTLRSNFPAGPFDTGRAPDHSRTNNRRLSRTPSASSLMPVARSSTRPSRDGPLMIPWVTTTITPLVIGGAGLPNAYAVRVCLPTPADADSDWLEFGLAQPGPTPSSSKNLSDHDTRPPRVEVASASVEGVPVRFETTVAVQQDQSTSLSGLGVPFEQLSGKEWVTWVRVHVGTIGGGKVQVDYVVKTHHDQDSSAVGVRNKGKANPVSNLDVFLPTFSLPVGRLDVNVEAALGCEILSFLTNLTHQQSSPRGQVRLLHYAMEELFYPRLSMALVSVHHDKSNEFLTSNTLRLVALAVPTLISLFLFVCLLGLGTELRQMKRSLESCSGIGQTAETLTLTKTMLTHAQSRWWFGDHTAASVPSSPGFEPSLPGATTPWSQPSPLPEATSERKDYVPMPIPTSHATGEQYALLPINNLSFPWPPVQFDLPLTLRATVDIVLDGFGAFWQVLRQAYHYPLEPP